MNRADMVYGAVSKAIGVLSGGSPDVPGELARLRRGVGKSIEDSPGSWSLVLSGLPDELLSTSIDGTRATEAETAVHTALTLYAVHQQSSRANVNQVGVSFASAMGSIMKPGDENSRTRMTGRFNALITSSDVVELANHARGVVQLMRASEPPVGFDYPRFAKDLYNFQFPESRRSVILRWGQDFYRTDKLQDIEDKKESERDGQENIR